MEKTRQPIPEGLAEMPPGLELAAVLDTIELARLSGSDCVEVLRARHRQANHEQAQFMAAMVEVALCAIGPDDQLPRVAEPDEFAADEIRAALAWTRRAADGQLGLAWDVTHRLPHVFAALDRGAIDVPKARVLSEWTSGLTDSQARQVCDQLLPEAPELTTGQLCERVKKLAIALDPEWARRRYEAAVRERRVVGYRNEDGTGNICGYQLPADKAAVACAHIATLAKKIKAAGDRRPTDHIRADLFIGMLDGSYAGWTETAIVTHMLTVAQTEATAAATDVLAPDQTSVARHSPRPASHDERGQHNDQYRRHKHSQHPDRIHGERDQVSRLGADHQHSKHGEHDQPAQRISPGGHRQGAQTGRDDPSSQGDQDRRQDQDGADGQKPARRTGLEIRAEVTTMLDLDDHPAEIPGWGHVHAGLARKLVREHTDAEWRYAVADGHGRLLFEGIIRARPHGYPARADAPCRGGILELQIKLSDLRRLAARTTRLGAWAKVIADLARQADQHEHPELPENLHDNQQRPDQTHRDQTGGGQRRGGGQRLKGTGDRPRDADGGSRSPGKMLRRRTQIRDRTCTYPGCRTPATGTDGDHTHAWADGGPTRDENIGSLCRHDHRLKHLGGWRVIQAVPGYFLWTSRLGRHYFVRPPMIIQPLPDPIPRHPPPASHHVIDADQDGEGDDCPTWWERPTPEAAPAPPPEPDPAAEIPPF
jgi:hypothetical protein